MFKENPKLEYINKEIWILTFGAAFQRAYVYKPAISDFDKNVFKSKLKNFVEDYIFSQYRSEVSEENHINNIIRLSDFTSQFSDILTGEKLKFGVCQKLLNLYLKYLWCLDKIPEPPHFPVDRRFQEEIKIKPIINWTQIENKTEYLKVIDFVKKLKPDHLSLAQFELETFERKRI